MKKIVALFAIVALTSCGNGTSSEVKSCESTSVCSDSTAKIDSVVSVVSDSTELVTK